VIDHILFCVHCVVQVWSDHILITMVTPDLLLLRYNLSVTIVLIVEVNHIYIYIYVCMYKY